MKELSTIITFNTTTDAIAAERVCKEKELAARLIPVPSVISAGCGMCLKCSSGIKTSVIEKLEKERILYSGVYQMLI